MIKIINPPSREEWLALRKQTIGASEIAALIGCHPFPQMTPYRLWAMKSGLYEDNEETDAMRRGRHMETVAVNFLQEERPNWAIIQNAIPGGKFYFDEMPAISATPDCIATDYNRDGFGVIQIKSVEATVFHKKWTDGENVEPPVGVAIQAIQEAALTGASWACVAPIIVSYGIEMPIIEIPIHMAVMDRLRAEAADFWRHVRNNDPPDPDFANDADVINDIFAQDNGETIDIEIGDDLLEMLRRREWLTACAATERAASNERKVIDAELKFMLGNAKRARLPDGRIIEAKTINRKGYEVEATSYRAITIKERNTK